MNTAKIAAALHALADAFLEGTEPATEPATERAKKGKRQAAEQTAPLASAPVAQATAAAAPASAGPSVQVDATATALFGVGTQAPTVTLADVNKLVLKVAAKNREGAVAILSKFKLTNTVGLPQELWQPVYDAFEEEIAKMDAAAVQISQASLV
jgi:hypothetical protein